MSAPLQNITITAPGFRGLNTQDSPIGLDPAFASVANNCIIDQYGRIGSRKGRELLTTNPEILGSGEGIGAISSCIREDGTKVVFSAGNNKIFRGTTTLVDATPAGYTITANEWKMLTFNYHCFFFQKNHVPLVYSSHDGETLITIGDHVHSSGTPPNGNEVLAAFGRLWVADITGDTSTIYWSDLLDGTKWSGGSSGSIDLVTVWPTGYDEIVGLAAHNGFLIIFGKASIVIYSGAVDPASMVLQDTIANVGCVHRDTIQNIGTDLLFLSNEGVRSLGRVIQEKSAPVRDISKNVRNDLLSLIPLQTLGICSVYSPEEAFYLLSFPSSSIVYCFDMRGTLEDGSNRVTVWTNTKLLSFFRDTSKILYLGSKNGISTYSGYLDENDTYEMKYFSNPLNFGDSSKIKILKQLDFIFMEGQNTNAVINWGYDFTESYAKQPILIKNTVVAEFNVNEFNTPEAIFNKTAAVDKQTIKPNGTGFAVTLGLDAVINSFPLSIQEINIQALLGRSI